MLAGQQHLHRRLARHGAGQRDGGRRAEQADIHAGRAEARAGRRHGQVAGRDELAAGGGGDALAPRRSPGCGSATTACITSRAAPWSASKKARPPSASARRGGDLAQVVAGAEGRALGGQITHAHARVRRDAGEGVAAALPSMREGERVARRRPVQHQHRDAVAARPQQQRASVGHGSSPRLQHLGDLVEDGGIVDGGRHGVAARRRRSCASCRAGSCRSASWAGGPRPAPP